MPVDRNTHYHFWISLAEKIKTESDQVSISNYKFTGNTGDRGPCTQQNPVLFYRINYIVPLTNYIGEIGGREHL